MTHREAAACDSRGGDNLKIVLGLEAADFQLAQADNGEHRRLDPADADHAANPWREQCFRRGPGEGKIEDLVRLLTRYRRLIERTQLGVWFEPGKGLLQRLWILRCEQSPPHAAAITDMIEDFLPNQLTFPIAIGRQDNVVAAPERRGDGFEFCRFVAFLGRSRREKPIRRKNDAGPVLPGGIDLLGLGQPKEMTFGCKDLSEPHTKGRAEIPRLAGLFRDDQSRHGARRIE